MFEPKIMVLSAVHNVGGDRKEVCEFFSRRMATVRKETGIETLIVGSEGDLSRKLAEDHGHYYVEFPNKPLSRKFNAGLEALREYNPTNVIVLDSDDITSTSLFEAYVSALERADFDLIGITDLYFLGLHKQRWGFGVCGYWNNEAMLAVGRCYSSRILDYCNWNLWPGDRDSGMGGAAMSTVQGYTDSGNKLKSVQLSIKEHGHMVIDIKTVGNISSMSNFTLKEENYRSLLSLYLPENEAQDIINYCDNKIAFGAITQGAVVSRVVGGLRKSEKNATTPKTELPPYNLNYAKHIGRRVGVLVVNYNNLAYTKACVQDLFNQINQGFDLWVVDQDSKEEGTKEFLSEISAQGVNVVYNTQNVDLNRVWNYFYEHAPHDYLCFLNNDVRIPNNFIDDTVAILEKESGVGVVIHATNNPEYVTASHDLNYEILDPPLYQGWDFCLRRELYEPIPESMRIFGGDDFLFSSVVDNGYSVAIAYSSPMIHFKEKTRDLVPNRAHDIQKQDAANYVREMRERGLVQVLSAYATPRSNKFPPEGIELTQNKNCVYTALIGDYDRLGESTTGKQDGWDYICFTDNKNLQSDFWRVVYIENQGTTQLENYKLARKIKTQFRERLSNYETLLWKDARIVINCDLNAYLQHLNGVDFVFLQHNAASSILQEFDRVVSGGLEEEAMAERIKTRYRDGGYLYDNGLIMSGILLFKNNHRTIQFFKDWWAEINAYSHRDQLSANFAMFKNPELSHKVISGVLGSGLSFLHGIRKTQRLFFSK